MASWRRLLGPAKRGTRIYCLLFFRSLELVAAVAWAWVIIWYLPKYFWRVVLDHPKSPASRRWRRPADDAHAVDGIDADIHGSGCLGMGGSFQVGIYRLEISSATMGECDQLLGNRDALDAASLKILQS